jgi:hypothetical protein
MFHDKIYRIAYFSATEAFEYLFRRGNSERRCLLIMKRAQSEVVNAPFLQWNKLLNHINYLGSIENTFYCRAVNHGSKISGNKLKVNSAAGIYMKEEAIGRRSEEERGRLGEGEKRRD